MEEFQNITPISQHTKKAINSKGKEVIIHSIHYVGLPTIEKKRMTEMYNAISRIESSFLIHFKKRYVEDGTLNIVSEYFPGETLREVIDKAKADNKPLNSELIWKTITEVALAIYDLHSYQPNPIAHGAIRPEHIILTPQGAKVCGISLVDASANLEKDILDFTAVIFEMVTLSPYQGHRRLDYPLLSSVDEGFRELLTNLIEIHNGHRSTIVQILEFPEVSIEVMKIKIAVEKSDYENQVQRVVALENDLLLREKHLKAAGIDTSSLPPIKC